ncbi:MAG: hypothetical protein JWR80_443 [Bradyrhizobium sp.]|nr:hypothetical protein [Bradyrhizobium sp.]
MALFTAIAAAIGLTGFFATAFVTVASFATSIGLSYIAKALSGNQDQAEAAKADGFSVQGKLQAGGTVPRSFNLGYSATAGSLVYANTWGNDGETPNAYFTQVIALSDMPSGTLQEAWVNGELVTSGDVLDASLGTPVLQYRKDGKDHLWIKYYDGTQTAADSLLVTRVASLDRPYPGSRVGHGVAYVICTALVEDTLFTGFPSFKFAVSGIPLYDISKDSSVGGVGSHRWSDRSTWGGDGDNLPAVQIYNLLRGVTYNGTWLYGLQSMTAARLPASNWIAQIAKCREAIAGEGGIPEPTYRAGGQINVDAQTANAVEALLTSCQGRISEIGGFYKIHLGAPDSPTFAWTDADLLSTEQQTYKPFFGLADSINGITGSFPYPAEGWATKVAPPYYRPDLEARDGNRRLLANPSFDFVPYSAQVQRLMKSALDEAQRARTHVLSFPPQYWVVEPGDIGSWTSLRNGYVDKLFRADAGTDKYNLDVILHLTEVDPADYDWDHETDFQGISTGPTTFPRPEPQGIVDWFAEPATIKDADGYSRRPAIRLSWDGSLPGVIGIQYEVRLTADNSHVTRGRSDQLAAGALLISQSILPDTEYEVRGQYIPSAPRDMLWSDWISVTTNDVRLQAIDIENYIVEQFTKVANLYADEIATINSRFDVLKNEMSRNWNDKKEVRSQQTSQFDIAYANIDEVRTTAVDTNTAFASFSATVTATFGAVTAQVQQNSSAIATLDGYAAAKWSVTTTVNGYVSGIELINGGNGVSAFTVLADKFQVALPGYNGGGVTPVFTIAAVNGVPKIVWRADMIGDGSITARSITAISLSSITANLGDVTAGVLRSPNGRYVNDLNAGRELWGD